MVADYESGAGIDSETAQRLLAEANEFVDVAAAFLKLT